MENLRILVVEDEAIVAKDLQNQLIALGYDVPEIASSGAKAIEIAKKIEPELVLMDIMLKGEMDGIQVAAEIKKLWNIPVIYLTAYSDKATLDRAKVTEPHGYLLKPFDERELRTVIEMAIYRSSMESRVKESEEQFRLLAETATDGIISIDTDSVILLANRAIEEIFGYTRDELVGEPLEKLMPENLRAGHHRSIGNYIKTGTRSIPWTGRTFEGLHKSGRLFPFEISFGEYTKQGKRIFTGFLRDITERKQAERKLAEETELLEVTLRSIGDGVISTDLNGRVVLMNELAEDLTGWQRDEAVGKLVHEIFPLKNESSRKPTKNPIDEVLEGKEAVDLTGHVLLIQKDGNELLIADSCAPIRSRDGQVIGAVLVFRDITRLRQMEAELSKAQKLESLGILAGGIAHDFNNILTGIIGNISMMKLVVGPNDPNLRNLLAAEKASVRAKDLTQRLLTFSCGGAPVKKPMSISQVIVDSADLALSGSSVNMKETIPDDLWAVAIDDGQISQVMHNLVTNAEQSMRNGGTIKITAENRLIDSSTELPLTEGRYIKISIIDHGSGIKEEHLAKLFDPYFTSKAGGSGLGLAICYSIIRNHDGFISVESTPGAGSTFSVYLPATDTPVPAESEMIATGSPTTGEGRILVMDDEETVRFLISRMLPRLGYAVECAADGEAAIAIYKKRKAETNPFDAVILDLTVPGGMGGKETMEELLKIDPNLIAIVSSGYSNDPVMGKYEEFGFKGVIMKPYDIAEMAEVLSEVLDTT